MPEYLATGRNSDGKKVTERVDTTSADEALRILRERGYDDIELHTDDVGAHYTRQSAVNEVISPGQILWFRRMPSSLAFYLIVTLELDKKGWTWCVLPLALLAYRRYSQLPWIWGETVTVVLLLSPLAWGLGGQFFRGQARRYRNLMEAVAWGRWEEVLAEADSVGKAVPADDIAFQKAKALAGLGRLEEGLRVVKPFSDGVKIPEWMYLSRLAGVYQTAKCPDESAASMKEALSLVPDNATILIDIANSEVWLRHNPRRARELLARARTHALSDVIKLFAVYTDGLIALEERREREASPLLQQAYEGLYALRHATPLMGITLDKIHVGLGLALAATGDEDAARSHFKQAMPRLQALKLDDHIARCEKALAAFAAR